MNRSFNWLSRRGLTALTLCALIADSAFAQGLHRVTIRGNGTELDETPVIVALKNPLPAGDYVLQATGAGPAVAAQVFGDKETMYLGFILDHVPGTKDQTFSLKSDSRPELGPRQAGVEMERLGANVRIRVGGKTWTEYLTDSGPKPYYFPVIGPTGEPFTRAYPMQQVEGEDKDHPHQRSLWFTHGKVNGIDFWSEQTTHGSIKETAKQTVVGGPAVGLIRTSDDWLDPDGKKVCADERVVRFYNTKTSRVFDFDITVKASAGPVTFGDTKEGMFGIRVASSMDVNRKTGGKITNAEGINNEDAWGKASPWVDYTGPVAGQTVGIAVLNHPNSFRYPTTWHVRTYGLFAANPFGWHDFGRSERGDYTIPVGASISFRYRVIMHKGETASAGIPAAFKGYAQPPEVEIASD